MAIVVVVVLDVVRVHMTTDCALSLTHRGALTSLAGVWYLNKWPPGCAKLSASLVRMRVHDKFILEANASKPAYFLSCRLPLLLALVFCIIILVVAQNLLIRQ